MRLSRFVTALGVVGAVAAGATPSLAVTTDRGTWYFDVAHALGSGTVVGNSKVENLTIGQFQKFNITRTFNSFANPVPPPSAADLGVWNAKLDAAGISSYLMLSVASDSANLSFFTDQLINFNSGVPAAQQYDAVKLDIEPQATGAWAAGTATDRRDMLLNLRDTYSSIRAHLDANGEAGTPIFADIPVWFDSTDGFIGWGDGTALTATQERDQWFSDIANDLDGLTLMAFGTSNVSVVLANTAWEIANFAGDVRIGIEADVGPAATFPDFPSLMDMVAQVEDFYGQPANNPAGHTIGIEFQNFTQLFTAAAPEPLTVLLSFMGLASLWVRVRRRV